jgi:hypothetical protein
LAEVESILPKDARYPGYDYSPNSQPIDANRYSNPSEIKETGFIGYYIWAGKESLVPIPPE